MTARRAAIGFQGGQVLSLRLTEEKLTSCARRSRRRSGGWRELEATDGAVVLDLAQVVYVRIESDEQRVGFCARCPASASAPNALDLALYRRVRASRARRDTRALGALATRAWASTARSGSRPARPASRSTPAAGGAGRARPRCVGSAYLDLDLDQGRGRPAAAGDRGPAAPDGDADRPLASRPRTRRRASPRRTRSAALLPSPPLYARRRRDGRSRGSTSASTTRPTSPPAPRSAPRSGSLGR